MFKFTKVSQISTEDVEAIFSDSSESYDAGTLIPVKDTTPSERWKSLLTRNHEHSGFMLASFTFQFKCTKDEQLVGLYYAYPDKEESNYLFVYASVYGRDADGSKSWLYTPEYGQAFRDFIQDNGFDGIKSEYIGSSAMNPHNENQRIENQNGYAVWEDMEASKEGFRLLKLTI